MSEYRRFISKASEMLKLNNIKYKNIISLISKNALWDRNYNDSIIKLNNYIKLQKRSYGDLLKQASQNKKGRDESMQAVANVEYQRALKQASQNKKGREKSIQTVANAQRRIQEKQLQEMELDLIADLNKESTIPIAPPIAPPIPIAPALVRLLDKKKPKDKEDECPHCDCPFGDYNKCKGNKDRPDDYMFEKTKDGKRVDLGKTIVNVYCGATNSTSVPRELATSALEINSAPQSVKQRVAEQLGETIKSIDTKAPEKKKWAVQTAKTRDPKELSPEETQELQMVRELQEQERAQAELKKAKDKTGNFLEPPKKVKMSDDVKNMLLGMIGNTTARIARQKEEEKKQAQSLPVLPDVPPPIPSGSGYYKKRRKTKHYVISNQKPLI